MPCKAREAAAFCLFEDSLAVQGTAFFQQVEAGSPPPGSASREEGEDGAGI